MEESDLDVAQVELTHDEGKMIMGAVAFCVTIVGSFTYFALSSLGYL